MAGFNRPEALKKRAEDGKASLLSFPSSPLPHGILLVFKDYDYANVAGENSTADSYETLTSGLYDSLRQSGKAEVKSNRSIELPFPRTLTDQHGIKVNGFERSFLAERLSSFAASALGGTIAEGGSKVGSAVKDAAGAGKDILGSLKNIGERLYTEPGAVKDELMSTLSMSGQNVSQVLTYIMQNYSGDIGRAMSAAGGAAVNPNETLAFEGVELKTFTFTWDLFPQSAQDSESIRQIIKLLRQNILPDYGSIEGLGIERALLRYPAVCFLELLGVDNSHWTKFKPCLISNMQLDYGAGGSVAILKGGKPVAVQLTLTFNELTIHTKKDYEGDIIPAPQADTENNAEEPTG